MLSGRACRSSSAAQSRDRVYSHRVQHLRPARRRHRNRAQLAIDRQIERARSRAGLSINSRVRIDQTWLGRSGGLAPISLPLFQGVRRVCVEMQFSSDMFVLPSWWRAASMHGNAQIGSAFSGLRSLGHHAADGRVQRLTHSRHSGVSRALRVGQADPSLSSSSERTPRLRLPSRFHEWWC